MNQPAPRVSVIVPAYNAGATIGRALDALEAQDVEAPYEVVVVDDGSSDDTARIVAEGGKRVRLVRQANGGPAAARNHGVEKAAARALAFIDADCVPARGWLRAGLAALDAAELVQGQVVPDPAAARGPFDRTITVRREYGLYEAANMFVTRELFERLRGFEDWLSARVGKPLAEDVWFGWRARRAGARTAFCAEAVVHHAVFRRGPGGYIAERLRLVYFPAMVRKMPELRGAFLHRRLFLSRRSAAFDLAVVAAWVLAGGGASGRRIAGALATLPYLRALGAEATRGGGRAAIVGAFDVLADATGLLALAVGSLRWRRCVL